MLMKLKEQLNLQKHVGKLYCTHTSKNRNRYNLSAGQKFTFEEAAAQAFGFFVAGFETSSTAMQFALYELALNPDMQEELRTEIKIILDKYEGKMTYEAIYDMDLLGRVIDGEN